MALSRCVHISWPSHLKHRWSKRVREMKEHSLRASKRSRPYQVPAHSPQVCGYKTASYINNYRKITVVYCQHTVTLGASSQDLLVKSFLKITTRREWDDPAFCEYWCKLIKQRLRAEGSSTTPESLISLTWGTWGISGLLSLSVS